MICPASRRFFCAIDDISGEKSFPATVAHKRPNTAFHSLEGVRVPPSLQTGQKPPHKGLTRGFAILSSGSEGKIRYLLFDFFVTFEKNRFVISA